MFVHDGAAHVDFRDREASPAFRAAVLRGIIKYVSAMRAARLTWPSVAVPSDPHAGRSATDPNAIQAEGNAKEYKKQCIPD